MSNLRHTLLSTLILISIAAFTQNRIVSVDPANGDADLATTEEEYNYLTKGYAIQVASGLDMKRGYSFVDFGTTPTSFSDGTRVTEFKGLLRDGMSTPCAILMKYSGPSGNATYICIPTYNASPDLWQRTFKQVHDAASQYGSAGMDTAVIMGLMHLSTSLATQ